MISDNDILQFLNDPRFEQQVLTILRRKLSGKEVSASDAGVPPMWGYITIDRACEKYGMTRVEVITAINSRHVRGTDTHVDEDSLRVMKYTTRTKARMEAGPSDMAQGDVDKLPNQGRAPRPSITGTGLVTFQEAADMLGITEERFCESVYAGAFTEVGEGKVSLASIKKHLEHLPAAPPPVEQRSEQATIATKAAAERLGCPPGYISTLVRMGSLVGAGHGKVTLASVEARLVLKAQGKKCIRAPKPPREQKPFVFDAHPKVAPEGSMTIAAAAKELNITAGAISFALHVGRLERTGRGFISIASVEAYKASRRTVKR